jgi:hypothetical protein
MTSTIRSAKENTRAQMPRRWFSARGLWRSPDDGGGAPAPAATVPATPAPGGKQEESSAGFSKEQQAELNRLMGAARGEGKTSATKALLEKLGVSDLETLEAKLKAVQEKEDAEKSELQKAADKLARLETKNAETIQKASRAIVKARAEALAATHGFDPTKVGEILASFGGFDGFKIDFETGEVEGLDKLFENLKALLGTPATTEGDKEPKTPPPARPFVRQDTGSKAPKLTAAGSYMSRTYTPKK